MIRSLERILCLKILLLYYLTLHVSTLAKSLDAAVGSKGPPWRILFFGSDDFSLRTLIPLTEEFKSNKKLISKLEVMVIDPETVVGKYAYEHRLRMFAYPPETEDELRDKYDVGILVSFGELIHKDVIGVFPFGILNAHPSLLPRWRGATPIPHAIMYGDHETGVSLMKIKGGKFDHGDIVKQTRTLIGAHEHTPELQERLAEQSAKLVMDVVRSLPKSVLNITPQSDENATYAPILVQEVSWIVWANMTSEQIYNRHRAISHLWPVATIWKCYVVKFHDIKIGQKHEQLQPESATVSAHVSSSSPKKKLHNLQAAPGRPFRKTTPRPPKRTKPPKGRRGRTTPGPTEVTTEEEFDELANNSLVGETHESLRKMRARYINETYEPEKEKERHRNIGPDAWLKPGLVMYDKSIKSLRVMCMDGAQLIVPRVTVSGRKTMDALGFHNGFLSRAEAHQRVFSEYSHFKGANARPKIVDTKF